MIGKAKVEPIQKTIEEFVEKWGPFNQRLHPEFVNDLRHVCEEYGKAALAHESLPDTEHEHGEPV